jgi:hypothetical protein
MGEPQSFSFLSLKVRSLGRISARGAKAGGRTMMDRRGTAPRDRNRSVAGTEGDGEKSGCNPLRTRPARLLKACAKGVEWVDDVTFGTVREGCLRGGVAGPRRSIELCVG